MVSVSKESLKEFVFSMDSQYKTPLSKQVDLLEYTDKLYEKAYKVVKTDDNGKIISAVIGYTTDLVDGFSYISLVGTLPEFRGKGYAFILLKEYIEYCKGLKIKGIRLKTSPDNITAINLYKSFAFEGETLKSDSNSLMFVLRF